MYLFDLNRRPILWAIVSLIQINHVQQATHQKYDWPGRESPSGYGPLIGSCDHFLENMWLSKSKFMYTLHPCMSPLCTLAQQL